MVKLLVDEIDLERAIERAVKKAECEGAQRVIDWLRANHWNCIGIVEKFKEWGVK